MYIVFAFPVFAIKGFEQRINKNCRTGINDEEAAMERCSAY